jgi:DNA mismatch repair ATPase MutS
MDELEGNAAFVLLDEILRGTNSDDKRNGTIEVVKKVIANKAIGAIATHDISVPDYKRVSGYSYQQMF